MTFVKDEDAVLAEVLDQIHAHGLGAAQGVQGIVGREDDVVVAQLAVVDHLTQLGIPCLCRRRLDRGALVVQGDFGVRIGHQDACIPGADRLQVAEHIRVQVGLGRDEHGRLAVFHGPANDGRVRAAFADTRLVPDDETAAALEVVDRHGYGIDLLGGKATAQFAGLVPQFPGDEVVDVADAVLQLGEGITDRLPHVHGDESADVADLGRRLVVDLGLGFLLLALDYVALSSHPRNVIASQSSCVAFGCACIVASFEINAPRSSRLFFNPSTSASPISSGRGLPCSRLPAGLAARSCTSRIACLGPSLSASCCTRSFTSDRC